MRKKRTLPWYADKTSRLVIYAGDIAACSVLVLCTTSFVVLITYADNFLQSRSASIVAGISLFIFIFIMLALTSLAARYAKHLPVVLTALRLKRLLKKRTDIRDEKLEDEIASLGDALRSLPYDDFEDRWF